MVITLLFTIVSILAISLLVLFHRHRSQFSGKNLPPGDIGYPVIGETYAFVSSGLKGHPENFFFDRVRKNSSHVFKTSFLGEKMAFLCGPAGNKFLFSNEEKLVKVWFPSSLEKIFPAVSETSFMDEAAKLRTILPVVLRPEALQRCFLAVVDQCTQSHFADDWENKHHVQVFPLASKYTLRLALRVFVGLETQADIEKLSKPFYLVTAGITSMPINFPGTLFRKAIKAASLIRNDLQKIIKQRKIDLADGKVQPTQDVLSHMLTTEEHDTYVKECAIADKILGTLVVGYHTLSVPLVFIVKYLGELPHVYDVVYKEQMEIANSKSSGELLKWDDLHKMKYSWNVAQEVMRIAPPGQGAFREAKTDFVFNGFTIPKGWKLYWSSSSTNKNPDYFPEPEKFDPSRFEGDGPAPYTFVPFGGGPRMCPGNAYARMVLLVFMHNLVKNFKLENIIPDEKITYSPFATPINGLPVRLFRHNKSAAIST